MTLLKPDGTPVQMGKNLIIVRGVNKGKSVKVSGIVNPNVNNHGEGMVTVNMSESGFSWQNYYPSVLGCYWGEEPQAVTVDKPDDLTDAIEEEFELSDTVSD